MSKKSHPGDGSHGKGVKGERTPFDEVFKPTALQRSEAGQGKESANPTEVTEDE